MFVSGFTPGSNTSSGFNIYSSSYAGSANTRFGFGWDRMA
jgi:hypothetical protein